jgi:hypothetical protein
MSRAALVALVAPGARSGAETFSESENRDRLRAAAIETPHSSQANGGWIPRHWVKKRTGHMSPISSIRIDVTKDCGTAEAAKLVGVTKRTLLQWVYRGLLKDPKRVRVAGIVWRVWTKSDIERARKVKAKMKRGPKPRPKQS